MSGIYTSMCSALLKEYFGEIVEVVGTFLMKQVSSCPLIQIVRGTSLPLDKVKSSLSVLIHHNFCDFMAGDRNIVEYLIKPDSILLLLHYERYAYCAQLLFGDPADILIEEILNHGRLTLSETLHKVYERLQEAKDATGVGYSLKSIEEKISVLVDNQFLIRCPYPKDSGNKIPQLSILEGEKFLLPQINLALLVQNISAEPSVKRRKTEFPDDGIYWRINHDRFFQYFRNEVIVQACSNHFDEKAAEVVKAILTLSENKLNHSSPTTRPVDYHEILHGLSSVLTSKELDSYLSVLCEGSKSFVSKADDRGNGMYVVNLSKVLTRLVESIAASVVQDRFGSKCARIFRILLSKKVLEPKQIEEIAMLHPKDTKEYIYKMFEENFIMSHDVPKGSDFSHGHTFYLLKIHLKMVCRMLLEHCYLALFNLIKCSEIQNQENKRLLEKKQRIDAIVASLRQSAADSAQIEEVQNIITPPEEAVIKKVTAFGQKIDSSQIQIAEMVLILKLWLDCKEM